MKKLYHVASITGDVRLEKYEIVDESTLHWIVRTPTGGRLCSIAKDNPLFSLDKNKVLQSRLNLYEQDLEDMDKLGARERLINKCMKLRKMLKEGE